MRGAQAEVAGHGVVCVASGCSCWSLARDFGEDRRPSGDFAVREDQQGSDQGGRPGGVGMYLVKDAPVLEMGEAVLDGCPDGCKCVVGSF